MSRVSEGDGDCWEIEDQLRGWAFEWNGKQTLQGRKGQKFLLELESALLALPNKRIATGTFVDSCGDVCPLASVMLQRRLKAGQAATNAVKDISHKTQDLDSEDGYDQDEIADSAARMLKIPSRLAYEIMWTADERIHWGEGPRTPEGKYKKMLDWVAKQIKPETRAALRQDLNEGRR